MSIDFRTRTPSVQPSPQQGFDAGILAEDRRMTARASTEASRAAEGDAVAWARQVGFPECAVPFAAIAAAVLKSGRRGGPVSRGEVEARLRATHPGLLGEAS